MAPTKAPNPSRLDSKPTRKGSRSSCSLPKIGIIAVKGKPNTLKTIVMRKTRRNFQSPSTKLTPAIRSRTSAGDAIRRTVAGSCASRTKTRQMAYTLTLRKKTPVMPTHCSITPPNSGPAMRVALLVAASRLIAADTESPAKSPTRRRRTGISVAQNKPLRTEAIAI